VKELGQTKKGILDLLWRTESPVSLKEVSQNIGLKGRSTNMHVLGLAKMGLARKTEAGYVLTDYGREALGFPKVDEAFAKKILGKTPPEKAFRFYYGIHQPAGISSDSLVDFCEKIRAIDARSMEFHTSRGDFELWASYLGDTELAKRLRLIRDANLTGESLRQRLYRAVKSRCDQLLKI